MRDNDPAMPSDTELELLITAVVGAADEAGARACCEPLRQRLGARVVECLDCSDEEPGCWSVMLGRGGPGGSAHPGALSRAVRTLLRELGEDFARLRVSCEPPTAWTVLDDPELVQQLVDGGERLLVEAWAGGSPLPTGGAPPEPEPARHQDVPSTRLKLLVDVVTDRRSGAEWPARALASRLCRGAEIISSEEQPPVVRVALDLGQRPGEPADVVVQAADLLGDGALGTEGWSRVRERERAAVKRWSAPTTPRSGIAAVELASEPDGAGEHREVVS
jgi:hypothetical protein